VLQQQQGVFFLSSMKTFL